MLLDEAYGDITGTLKVQTGLNFNRGELSTDFRRGCGARPKWDFPPSCAELTGGSAPSPVAAPVEVAETATAKTGGIRHGARKLLINVHTKTRNPF
jgi:hypothetical protein